MTDRVVIKPTIKEVEQAIRTLLIWAGEDPMREGLLETPTRVARSYLEFFCGYQQSAEKILDTVFEDVAGYDNPVFIQDIAFFSHCEHHMVPIVGKAYIAYLPDKKIIGLSKIPRIVEVFARRLQTQETLTAQIANVLDTNLQPKGVAVLIKAEHFCMSMRGVQKQGILTITTAFRGLFKNDEQLRNSFMRMQGL